MSTFRHILFFITLVLLQVLIFNNIFFHGYLNPYVYVSFILLLPLNLDRAYVLILAFLMGLCIDIFENSGGVHIAATVFLGFIRRPVLRLSSRRQGLDFEESQIDRMATGNLIVYFLLAIFLHHFVLFLVESYSFRDIGTVLVRSSVSSIFTAFFVLLLQLWRFRKKA